MDFNVMDYLAYHADVAVPAIILNFLWYTSYKNTLFDPFSLIYSLPHNLRAG